MPDMPQEPNYLDPTSPDYAYASRSSARDYQSKIDSEYGVPDEYVQERKRLEKQTFQLVGQITQKYYQQVMDALADFQPTQAPQAAAVGQVSAPTGGPGARYIQGKPPGWRGVRGILRWLWYGRHADNPDYAPYEVNPGEEQETQREWASLSEYSQFLSRAEVAADRIAEEVFGDVLSESNDDIRQTIANLLNQFKNELIRNAIRPMFHQFWRTGLHRGIEMQGGEKSDTVPTAKTDDEDGSAEPVSGGKPDGAARTKGDETEAQTGTEPVSTSRPAPPPKRQDDKPTTDDSQVSGNDDGTSSDDNTPTTGADNNTSTTSTSQSEPPQKEEKPKNKGTYRKLLDMMDEMDSPAEALQNPKVLSYLESIGSAAKKKNAVIAMHKKHPFDWKDIEKSLEAFIDSELYHIPGGIKAALGQLEKRTRDASPEEVGVELGNNKMLSHMWNLFAANKALGLSVDTLEDEMRTILNKRKAAGQKPPQRKARSTGTVPKVKKRPTTEGDPRKRKKKKEAAGKKAEDIVTQASKSDDEANVDTKTDNNADTNTSQNVDDENIVTMAPRAGASETEVEDYIKKAVKDSMSDDPAWIQKTKQDLWKLLDSWIGDDGKKTDWIGDKVDEFAADLYTGGSFDDDMKSDMENLGDRGDDIPEAMTHMIGRKWLNSLTLESRKRYYKILMQEGRSGPYVQRSVVDRMPLKERNAYYRALLKG